jgi:DNA-directed RNA polymerase III subunit RPC3
MLPAKDIREAVAALSKAGFIMQQEVPRTVDRNPSRAFFLWHVSRPHCYRLLLNRLYEALVNLYVRREHEREQHKALLRRSERSDVRENIQLLDSADRQELDVFEWRLESLGVAQERIDRDIFVLETMPAYTS